LSVSKDAAFDFAQSLLVEEEDGKQTC
jgi:hypothetical protein